MPTSIEWTQETWNPVTGCTKVSHVLFHQKRLATPLRWKKPRYVFVSSMSDLFHKHLPEDVIDRIFAVMALAPRHTFQVLTKRPERMQQYLSDHRRQRVREAVEQIRPSRPPRHWYHIDDSALAMSSWPLPNVWLGVSVEDQAAADLHIPLLLETPAAVRFVSVEPLLGPVDPSWVRSLRDQCMASDTPLLFKQRLDERGRKVSLPALDGRQWAEMPGLGSCVQ